MVEHEPKNRSCNCMGRIIIVSCLSSAQVCTRTDNLLHVSHLCSSGRTVIWGESQMDNYDGRKDYPCTQSIQPEPRATPMGPRTAIRLLLAFLRSS